MCINSGDNHNKSSSAFWSITNQVIIWPNTKEFPEVTESNRSIGLKAKVTVVMSRCQVAAFTENTQVKEAEREMPWNQNPFIQNVYSTSLLLPTWGRRCFRPPQNPAWEHPFLPFDLSCPLCEQCPAGWHLSERMTWSTGSEKRKTVNNILSLWLPLFQSLISGI